MNNDLIEEKQRELRLKEEKEAYELKKKNDETEKAIKESKMPKILKYLKNELKNIFGGDEKK